MHIRNGASIYLQPNEINSKTSFSLCIFFIHICSCLVMIIEWKSTTESNSLYHHLLHTYRKIEISRWKLLVSCLIVIIIFFTLPSARDYRQDVWWQQREWNKWNLCCVYENRMVIWINELLNNFLDEYLLWIMLGKSWIHSELINLQDGLRELLWDFVFAFLGSFFCVNKWEFVNTEV